MKIKFHEKHEKELSRKIDHYSEAINIYQLQDLANRKFKLQTYTYYSTGAMNQETLDDNENAYKRYKILPKILVDVSKVDLSVVCLGQKIDMPICIAPTAFHRLAHFNGEIETAKAATELDIIMCLSTLSSVSSNEVANYAKYKWFQLYIQKNLSISEKQIQMVEKAGYTALVVTCDAPVMGVRDLENLGKFEGPEKREVNASTNKMESGLGQFFSKTFNTSLDWSVINWLKKITKMKIVLKGVHRGDDAIKAVECGVDAIIVSNHGGRQIDSTLGSIDLLALVTNALRKEGLENKIEVYVDGGIRRGTDVFKALALGAKAVFVGRPSLWGLGAGGKEGVIKAFHLLKREFLNTMMLAGCSKPSDITRDYIITTDNLPKF